MHILVKTCFWKISQHDGCWPLRSYRNSGRSSVKEETLRLFEKGIIEPSHFSWRSQVLINKDENHKSLLSLLFPNS